MLCGALNSAQSNQSFAVESIVMTKLLFRDNAWLIMRNPLNRLYKHTMWMVLSICLLIGSGDGSMLIICHRGRGRIKAKLQISACCELWCTYVHFSPQLQKSGTSTSVSINSTAERPSGWALPRILVYVETQTAAFQDNLTSLWLEQFVCVEVQHQQSSDWFLHRLIHVSCPSGTRRNTDVPPLLDYNITSTMNSKQPANNTVVVVSLLLLIIISIITNINTIITSSRIIDIILKMPVSEDNDYYCCR